MKTFRLIAVLLLAGIFTVAAQDTKWTFDPAHSKIKFISTHMGISEVDGEFKKFDGHVHADKADFTDATATVTIDASSVETGIEKRDNHLRSEDFLYVKEHPNITFEGAGLKKSGDHYVLMGDLTIRGVTRPVELTVKYFGTIEDPYGQTRAGFKVTGTINRYDYKVDWNKSFAGGLIVGEDIDIVANVELVRQEAD